MSSTRRRQARQRKERDDKAVAAAIRSITESQAFGFRAPLQAVFSVLEVRVKVKVCRRRVVRIVVEAHGEAPFTGKRADILAHGDHAPNE